MFDEASTSRAEALRAEALWRQIGDRPSLAAANAFVSRHFPKRNVRFFMTATQPCPYLPGLEERKMFAHLPSTEGVRLNDELTPNGFRRSQTIAYKPSCERCAACVSCRLPVAAYVFSRSEQRVLQRNAGLTRQAVPAEATPEQFELMRRYLTGRHPGGGMSEMTWPDFVTMVEESTVRTQLVEYRTRSDGGGPGDLVACCLVDRLSDGLSLVYSFYDPTLTARSLGRFVILDHLQQARAEALGYVYLGYWIASSAKMAYKVRFDPVELLRPSGWRRLTAAERATAEALPKLQPPPSTVEPKGLPPGLRRRTAK